MCSIFGIGFLPNHKLENQTIVKQVVTRLFKEAQSRGREASGLSIMTEKNASILRRPISGSSFSESEEYSEFMSDSLNFNKPGDRIMSIIGHCRWPTKGHKSNYLNNHPQIINHIIGIHNGVISNDDELFNSFEGEFERKAEVDTEIIFQLIAHFNKIYSNKTVDAIQKSCTYLDGNYACGLQNTRHPYNLYLFRNRNPIDILYYPKMKIILFATSKAFIEDAFEDFVDVQGEIQRIDIEQNSGLVLNLWSRTMCKFSLTEEKKLEGFASGIG